MNRLSVIIIHEHEEYFFMEQEGVQVWKTGRKRIIHSLEYYGQEVSYWDLESVCSQIPSKQVVPLE